MFRLADMAFINLIADELHPLLLAKESRYQLVILTPA